MVIGAGSLGSNITNIIARMGARNITVYDNDILTPENLAPSFASRQDLSMPKVDALKAKLYAELGIEINAVNDAFGKQRGFSNVMVIAVDSLNMRRYIWNNHRYEYDIWIDARMGDDQAGVYTHVRGCPTEFYESTMEREEAQMLCGQKATAPLCVGLVPGMVGVVIMRYLNQLSIPKEMFAKVLMPIMFYSISNPHQPV